MDTHTPTPWSYDLEDEAILDSDGNFINTWNEGRIKDAEFVVQACNAYELLMRTVIAYHERGEMHRIGTNKTCLGCVAIAKAEAK